MHSATKEMNMDPTVLRSSPSSPIPGPNLHKLRKSCDPCNLAKVKCSKDQPSCSRCKSRGMQCVYSISLRSVKRPRNANHPQPVTSPPQGIVPSELSSQLPHLGLEEWDFGHQADSVLEEETSSNCDLLSFVAADIQLPLNPLSFSPPCLTSSDAISGRAISSYTDLNNTSTTTSSASSTSTTTTASTLPTSNNSPLPSLRPCGCQRAIVRKLAELNIQKSPRAILLDDFLTDNKATMAVCRSVLECCDGQHKTDLLLQTELAALLVHIVSLYSRVFSCTNERQTLCCMPVRLCFGSYQLEQHEEQLLQANIVKIELAKLSALIEDFDRCFCARDDSRWGSNPHPSASLLAYLKHQLRSNFDALQSWTSSM